MKRPLAVLAALACARCLTSETFPGDEVMGTFSFQAEELSKDCQLSDIPEGGFGPFTGTFSRIKGQPEAWLTLGEVSREAVFDGQVVSSTRRAPRRFPECQCDDTEVEETLTVALLSKSQDQEVERLFGAAGCPPSPLDGGVPAPDVDEGIVRPDSTERGFDAVRACGVLVDVVVPGQSCQCEMPCTLTYRILGERK
ncbi:MAG: hypothetical protein ACOZIN_20665 [Myxococcota bacterium]